LNNKIVLGSVIGLVVGLVLGIFVGVLVISPSGILPSKTGGGTNEQVQVSGTIQDSSVATIKFTSLDETITSSVPDVNGAYSILLLGNQSYIVQLIYQNGYIQNGLSTYVPSGVTTFTANF
jgi:hypothetical protein